MSSDEQKRSRDQHAGPVESSGGPGGIAAWIQLVRLPNVFTVLADVGAAFLLVSGGPWPTDRFAAVLVAGVCLYWAGMILNDVFDVEKDSRERKTRPIPSGAVSLTNARTAGWSLLILGVLIGSASGYLPSHTATGEAMATTWLPAAVSVSLAVLIVLYDGPLKPTPAAPLAMGGCRVFSFLLGAAPVLPLIDGTPAIPRYLMGIAVGMGVYVMGITTFAREEATGGNRINLRVGYLVMMIGAMMLAFAPGLSGPEDRAAWSVLLDGRFAILVCLIVLPVAYRGFRAQFNPDPSAIGNTIRAGLMTLIPLAATFAFLGAGEFWGLAVFAMVIPALALSMRVQVT